MKKSYKTVKINKWSDFKELANNTLPEWIFRGQENADWEIRSSLERSGLLTDYIQSERKMLYDFVRAANNFLDTNLIPKTTIEWVALMQHYGAPTRLIDFTKSPYIAAFFAFESDNNYENVAIWIANKISFYQKTINYISDNNLFNINPKNNLASKYTCNFKTFDKIFDASKDYNYDFIFPIEAEIMNNRYYIQQSIFLCQANPMKSFNNQLDFFNNKEHLIKITIPKSEREIALRDLEKMNITRATLFPDLEGFTKSLKTKYEILQTISDLGIKRKKLKNMNIL